MVQPADVKCERSVDVVIASLLLSLSRHACAGRPSAVTITFVDVDVNNTVVWTLIASSVCVREQYSHLDSERVVCLRI